ncbi:MAG: EAL domain-containing response regulator [Candidatus Methylumidiphilus sp.]
MSDVFRVLLVEDNPGDADLIDELLPKEGDMGFSVQCVPRLAAALEQVKTNSFDVILLDLGLPDSAGLDTLLAMRKGAAGLPIVVLTGNDDDRMGLAAIRQGAQDYVVKGHVYGPFLSRILRFAVERRQIEERLRQAATVFENTNEGITVTDAQERILMVNRAFCELTGYTEQEVLGKTPRIFKSGRHDRIFYASMWADIKTTGRWRGEVWDRRKDGEIYPELLSISAVRDESGETTHYVGIFADLSRIKASEARLEFLAHHDPLTELPNRLMLCCRLELSIELARREGHQLALLILDLDHFKDVNDSFGHLAGDELLKCVADRLLQRLRGSDMLCRLGGDEFAVLLDNLSQPQDAIPVALDFIRALGETWHLDNGIEVHVGTSIGISLFPDQGQTAEELLSQADAALYKAKATGRGTFQFFSDDLTLAARERVALETQLRKAIIEDELRVYYQAQIDIATGRIIGAEALVRWQHPTQGLTSPNRFIAMAEETGLIGLLGEWVLRETCRQGQQWIEAGLLPISLAVNISAHQLRYADIEALVCAVLAETGFPAECLELELTESTLMRRELESVAILQSLRDLGVSLSIDDFGTGYSSLAYLKLFPLDTIKIDKQFIDDIPDGQSDMEITSAIIAMAHALRLKVLAEGVETLAQLEFLQKQGCDRYQGYYHSQPLPAEEFVRLLHSPPW